MPILLRLVWTNSLTVTDAVSIGAGTGTGDNKILAVGSGIFRALLLPLQPQVILTELQE